MQKDKEEKLRLQTEINIIKENNRKEFQKILNKPTKENQNFQTKVDRFTTKEQRVPGPGSYNPQNQDKVALCFYEKTERFELSSQ